MRKQEKKSNRVKAFLKTHLNWVIPIVLSLLSIVISIIIYFIIGSNIYGAISNFIQVATAIFAVSAWFNTQRILEKRKKKKVRISGDDIILLITLAKKARIDETVLKYLNESKIISDESRASFEEYDKGAVLEDLDSMTLSVHEEINGAFSICKKIDMPDYEDGIRSYINDFISCIGRVTDEMNKNNIGTIHVFIAAPVEISAFIMPFFTNKKNVIMYKYSQAENTYVQIGEVDPNRDEV